MTTPSNFLGDSVWLGGDRFSLADIYIAPMLEYFLMVPEGREMFSKKKNLEEWWRRTGDRESNHVTRPAE